MHRLFHTLFGIKSFTRSSLEAINKIRADLASLNNSDLQMFAQRNTGRLETIAAAAVVAYRLLGLEMFDVHGVKYTQRGATWTYLTTDLPFGTHSERILRAMVKKMKKSAL
jgi:hypothetical protein